MANRSSRQPCILVVDDDADQLYLTRRMLERAEVSHPIVEINGGASAMEYLAACGRGGEGREPPAVVFLDLKMPVVDGFAVLSWIRGNPALDTVRVIILSNSDDPKDVKVCSDMGAQGYLMKYPNPAVFSCVLRQALGESSRPLHAEHKE